MLITARGWKRDHGITLVADGDLAQAARDDDELMHYDQKTTYVRVLPPQEGPPRNFSDKDCNQTRVRVSVSQAISLNGRYQVQCILTKQDIADLFQMTHGQDSLDEIVAILTRIRTNRPLRRPKS
jgi:hypothetical protein